MESYRIYTGNNCKIIKENISECLEALSIVSNKINTSLKDPNMNSIRNYIITHIKTLLNKINKCNDLLIPEINDLYKKPKFDVLCLNRGFKQHEGECWNDSIMMFFCYQDEIKEIVQRKLYFLEPEEIIELAYSKREINLPKMFENIKYKTKFIKDIIEYLRLMKIKFRTYYNNIFFPQSKDISVSLADQGIGIIKQCSVDKKTGADIYDKTIFIKILSFFLLDTELDTVIIEEDDINDSLINDYFAFQLTWLSDSSGGHATCIYKCDGILYHFDDNNFDQFDPNAKAKSVPISNITYITNSVMKLNDDDFRVKRLIAIRFYNKTLHKNNTLNIYFKYELELNVYDNIKYYITNGANSSELKIIMESAIYENKIDTIRILLDNGVDPNTKPPSLYNSYLERAISNNNIELVRLLLNKGADPNKKPTIYESLILQAISNNYVEIVRLLLDHGVDPNQRDSNGYSLLFIPIMSEYVEIVRLLVAKGINKNDRFKIDSSRTISEFAQTNGNTEIRNLLR
jgi:hypothetical protein